MENKKLEQLTVGCGCFGVLKQFTTKFSRKVVLFTGGTVPEDRTYRNLFWIDRSAPKYKSLLMRTLFHMKTLLSYFMTSHDPTN
jgi:peptide methionine sulfoxide reductase MsrA